MSGAARRATALATAGVPLGDDHERDSHRRQGDRHPAAGQVCKEQHHASEHQQNRKGEQYTITIGYESHGRSPVLDGRLFELPRDPFEELLDVCEPFLGRRRVCLYDVDLMVQRLDLRQLHQTPPFAYAFLTRSPALSDAHRIRDGAVPISVDDRNGRL